MFNFFELSSRIFGAEAANEGGGGGIGALGVNGKALLLQLATFVIVFLLLKKFALDKIIKLLNERSETIDKGVSLGQQMIAEKERLSKEVDKILQKATEEADKIIASGNKEANALLKAAEESAAKKTAALMIEARARISEDIDQARQGLEKETLKLIAEATEVVLQEKLDATKDNQLITRALKEAKSL